MGISHTKSLFPPFKAPLKNCSYVYQTYRLSGEMLFLETLPDYYHTTIILDMECYLNNANLDAY